ncbi:hypothetical protein KCP76_15345 [Salmonella enterica subsp. enterica serovar Weltevreden]|nr:hypothetical protein KCP76_15345 [Salmonella enterica subsp. enterica serovar Weltevreden]
MLDGVLWGAWLLLVGPNFGCGSSREHAVWGLKQLGSAGLCVSTFAGIFDDNCSATGSLTISLDEPALARTAQLAAVLIPILSLFHSIAVKLRRQEGNDLAVISELKRAMLAARRRCDSFGHCYYLPEIEI